VTKLKLSILKIPIVGRWILAIYRAGIVLKFFRPKLIIFFKWLLISKETTNFTYDLEEHNKRYLASLISNVLNIEHSVIEGYFNELEGDNELRRHLVDMTAKSDMKFLANQKVEYGRRIGWYAFARVLKPRIIIETGVDKGLGACVLTAALKKNQEEGFEGRYYGTDINPKAGYLLSKSYSDFGKVLYGDSIESLNKFEGEIDLFINDSDHSDSYEKEEYKCIANKLSQRSIVLGDNSHCSDKLFLFSLKSNRHFVYFQEKPADHWYPGAGIGISFKR
jgi:predicted O-methyltransferase YrrM